jgi:cobalamin biosynthesis Mg chelatase CobN
MRAFEIHTFRDGNWKVDSVFDDKELAIHEARKVDEGSRYAGVRVIEENYDEASDLTTTRTVFRGKTAATPSKSARPAAKNSRGSATRSSTERARNSKSRARKQKKKSSGILVPVVVLFLLIVCGVGVMVGLQYVGGMK